VAERFGDDPNVHTEVDALSTVGVAQLVRGESHTQVALRPPGDHAVDHVVAESVSAAVLLADQRIAGLG
jgi:hypothetical protein